MPEERFAFGKNWSAFVERSLSEQRIEVATQALRDLLGMESLSGETFLDIGSGSGLHSLAAHRLGVRHIISFDYDMDAVQTTAKLRASAGDVSNWEVFQGSILDPALVDKYRASASIVYSWGVLHHTGNMWQAIRNAAQMVQPGGLFCIAIYNRVDRWLLGGSSETWRKIKRTFVNSPPWRKRLIVWAYKVRSFLYTLLRLRQNPITHIRQYSGRGMSWHSDVVDWVGGYPFEFASVDEVVSFCEHELGLSTVKVVPRSGHACSEYVFRAKV